MPVLYSTLLEATSCGECGMPFGLPHDFSADRHRDGKTFYCPNGHRVGWSRRDLEKELKQANDRTAAERARADQAERSRSAWKGQATRARNRAVSGECPLCGHHLRDLERHMGRVHADETPREFTEADATADIDPQVVK